jgi:hypothetical protein
LLPYAAIQKGLSRIYDLLSGGVRWASCQTSGRPNCERTTCSDGVCVLLQTTCQTKPCFPIPYCVSEAGGSYNLHKLNGKTVKQRKAVTAHIMKLCAEMVVLLLLFLMSVLDGMLQLSFKYRSS